MNWPKTSLLLIVVLVFLISGCATYKRTGVEIGPLDAYQSKISNKGITVAADPIDDEEDAKENFYVDVTKANFFPVLIIVQNDTSDRIYLLKESVEMTDTRGNYYRPVSSEVMADALKHNEFAYLFFGGILSYMSADEANRKMASDWRDKELPDTIIINPGRMRHGFLYFELDEGETLSGNKLSFIIEKLESKEKFHFEIVLPKTAITTALKFDSSQNIPIAFNPEEPWTGKWKVEGSRICGGTWGLKQNGRIVKSNSDSYYEIEANASGSQLKGKIVGDYDITNKFVLKISSDGQSFKGTLTSGMIGISGRIKGTRQPK